ncbi:MAG: hypothetical protein MUE81_15600 [Thermoflexibacter sp.]|nr:hypothetical protein [Thermoflexibacter sp.]
MSILSKLFLACFSPKIVESCFTKSNYEQVVKYCKWKSMTSKIGKNIVNKYEVEVNENQELVFKDEGYTLFKFTAEGLLLILPIKGGSEHQKLTNKANEAFCELVRRATIWGGRYNEHFNE